MSTVSEIRKAFTLKSILIGCVAVFVMSFLLRPQADNTFLWRDWGGWGGAYDIPKIAGAHRLYLEWNGHTVMSGFGYLMLIMLCIALINKIRPKTFSIQECIAIAIMVPISYFWGQHMDFGINILAIMPALANRPLSYYEKNIEYFKYWALGQPTSIEYWKSIVHTSNIAGVNWLAHIPAIAWDVVFMCSSGFFMLFIMLLTRRLILDVEALSFPTVQIVNHIVGVSQPTEESKKTSKKLFLIALVLTLAYLVPLFLVDKLLIIFTGSAPSGYGKGRIAGIDLWPAWDLCPQAILPWVPLYISFVPWEIGWYTLMPVDTLISIIVVWIGVWFILPLYYSSTGYWPKFTPGLTVRHVNFQMMGFYGMTTRGETLIALMIGMLIAMAIIPIWRHRRVMIPILKSITGKEPPKEIDPNPPIPYKFVWLGIIVSGLAWVMSGVAITLPLNLMLIYVILMGILTFGLVFMYGETGGYLGIWTHRQVDYWHGFLGMYLIKGLIDRTHNSPPLSMAYAVFEWDHFGSAFPSYAILCSWYTPHSIQLAQRNMTEAKVSIKAVMLAFVVAAIAGAISFFFFLGFLPLPHMGIGRITSYTYDDALLTRINSATWMRPIYESGAYLNYMLMVIGFILPFVITFARQRFRWFKITAAGVLFGLIFGHLSLVPMIAGFAIKYGVLKIGGAKMYEEKVVPLCAGTFVAAGIVNLIHTALSWIISYMNLPWAG
ncbi:MAG: DUF6785 family protein [Candidatus Bathyarchaeia archaeon]